MRDAVWKNADGLEVGFGRSNTKNLQAGSIEVKGQVRQLELEVYFDEANTGASAKNAVLPVGAVVLSATVYVKQAFVGGTALNVGTIKNDGSGAAATALVTATESAVANLTAGAVIKGAGALIGATVATDPVQITCAPTGSHTAGRATVLIEYIQPSAA